VLAPWAG